MGATWARLLELGLAGRTDQEFVADDAAAARAGLRPVQLELQRLLLEHDRIALSARLPRPQDQVEPKPRDKGDRDQQHRADLHDPAAASLMDVSRCPVHDRQPEDGEIDYEDCR